MSHDHLGMLLAPHVRPDGHFDPQAAVDVAEALFVSDPRGRLVAASTAQAIVDGMLGEAGRQAAVGAGIKLDLAGGLTRTATVTVVLGAVLALAGVSGIPAIVLPTVLPLLVDIQRVRLERREEELWLELVARPGALDPEQSPEALYQRLPEEMQAVVSPLDFAQFLQKLHDAGLAEGDPRGLQRLRERAKVVVRLG